MRKWMSRLAGPWSGRREARPPCRPALEALEDRFLLAGGVLQNNLVADSANQQFVARVYQDLLERPVDSAALSYWSAQLDLGVPRIQLVTALQASEEYHVVELNDLYVHLLNRPVDPFSVAYFDPLLDSGGTLQQVESQILGSDEYFIDHGGTNGGFMLALYQDTLNRSVDNLSALTYGGWLDGGLPRSSVAMSVLQSPEFASDQLQGLFTQYLHQSAIDGQNSILPLQLQAGQRDAVVADLLASNEYFTQS